MRRHHALIGLFLGLLALAGCIKQKLVFTVYPDGSGKMETEIRTSEELDLYALFLETLETLEEMGGEVEADKIRRSFEKSLFEKVGQNITGLKAWTMPAFEKEGDEPSVYRFTGYFKDIEKIRILPDEDDFVYETFTFEQQEDESYLFQALINLKKPSRRQKMSEEEEREAREEGRELMEGWEAVYTARLPGKVRKSEGIEAEGREGTFRWDADRVLDILISHAKNSKKSKKVVVKEIVCEPEEDLADEMEAFEEEMADAVKEWKALKKSFRGVKPLGK
jgi:hypothetical protein